MINTQRATLPACPQLAGKVAAVNISIGGPAVAPTGAVTSQQFGVVYLNGQSILAPIDIPMLALPIPGPVVSPVAFDQVQFNHAGTPALVPHPQTVYQVLEHLNPVNANGLQLLYALNLGAAYPAPGFTIADYGNQGLCAGTASPLIVQLSPKGGSPEPLTLSSIADGVLFDILGENAYPEKHRKQPISWLIPGSRAENYFLTLPNEAGLVTGINELFGNNTAGPDGRFAENGYEALRKYDLNHDGVIDREDPIFSRLRLWADVDGDGVAEVSELHTLDQLEVRTISLDYNADYQEVDPHGNIIKYKAIVTTHDGESHLAFDIWFKLNAPMN